MAVLWIAIIAGWLTLAGPPPALAQDEGAGVESSGAAAKPDTARADWLSREGWRLWQSGEPAAAIAKFEEAVEIQPDLTNAWNGLGWARFNGGDSEAALVAFEKVIELEPKHMAALNGLGQVHLSWREYEEAEKHLKRASRNASAAWWGLAKLYLLTGEYSQAQRWIRKAMTQSPGDASLKQMMAAAKAKNLDPALRAQIEGPGKPSGNGTAQGWVLFNQGKWSAAEKAFTKAIEADPDDMAAHNGLGFALLNQGEAEQAKPHFEKCLEANKSAAGPMNGLARCLKAEGDDENAIDVWLKMQELHPGVNAATVGLATTWLELENYRKALPYYERLVESAPDNAMFKQGLAAAKAGLTESSSSTKAPEPSEE